MSTTAGAVLGAGDAVGLAVVGLFELVGWGMVVAVVVALVVVVVAKLVTGNDEAEVEVDPAEPLDAHADASRADAAAAMTMIVCCFMNTLCDASADPHLTVSAPASGRSQVSARLW